MWVYVGFGLTSFLTCLHYFRLFFSCFGGDGSLSLSLYARCACDEFASLGFLMRWPSTRAKQSGLPPVRVQEVVRVEGFKGLHQRLLGVDGAFARFDCAVTSST